MMGWILTILLILAWTLAPDGPDSPDAMQDRIPRCTEDAVLVGTGSFDNGRWSAYVCGPAVDDYEEG